GRDPDGAQLQPEFTPKDRKRRYEVIDVAIGMQWRRRESQTLRSAWHRRIVDRLDVDAEAGEQGVRNFLAQDRVAHHHGHNVTRVIQHGKTGGREPTLQRAGPFLVALPLHGACFQVPDAGERPGDDDRSQRGGEYEAWRAASDGVDAGAAGRDVAAHHTEALGERRVYDVDPVEDAIALGDASAAWSVHADRVHFIEIGEGAIPIGQIADRRNRGDGPVHGVDGLEG